MIGTNKKTTNDFIVESILQSPATAKQLHEDLSVERQVTQQAIYKQLTFLVSAGVLVKQKHIFHVSHEWRDRVFDMMNLNHEPLLQNGEMAVHHFKSLEQLDAYWKHIMRAYHQWFEALPVFLIVPHQFWYHVPNRKESEENFYRSFKKRRIHAYNLIKYHTPWAQQFRKNFKDDYFHIEIGSVTGVRDTDNITIIGDLIINSKVPTSIANQIHTIYTKGSTSGSDFNKEISEVLSQKFTTSIRIERNQAKADAMRKRFDKYFYIQR